MLYPTTYLSDLIEAPKGDLVIRSNRGWIVTAKLPRFHSFPPHYFPRQFHYKHEAEECASIVRSLSGTATVHKASEYHEQARIADSGAN